MSWNTIQLIVMRDGYNPLSWVVPHFVMDTWSYDSSCGLNDDAWLNSTGDAIQSNEQKWFCIWNRTDCKYIDYRFFVSWVWIMGTPVKWADSWSEIKMRAQQNMSWWGRQQRLVSSIQNKPEWPKARGAEANWGRLDRANQADIV